MMTTTNVPLAPVDVEPFTSLLEARHAIWCVLDPSGRLNGVNAPDGMREDVRAVLRSAVLAVEAQLAHVSPSMIAEAERIYDVASLNKGGKTHWQMGPRTTIGVRGVPACEVRGGIGATNESYIYIGLLIRATPRGWQPYTGKPVQLPFASATCRLCARLERTTSTEPG